MVGFELMPGTWVRILTCGGGYGVVVEHCPDRGGYLVRSTNPDITGGLGYNELEVAPQTAWERITEDSE